MGEEDWVTTTNTLKPGACTLALALNYEIISAMKLITALKTHAYWLMIFIVSSITHLFMFGYPREAVFDEVYFAPFVSSYFTHSYFFDIHPPLAKLIIGIFAFLFGAPPLGTQMLISDALPPQWILVRIVPLIAGVFLPCVIYTLLRRLGVSKLAAFVAGMLIVFESSLLVQSRFVLLDSMLLLSGFGGLSLYLRSRAEERTLVKVFAISCLTCAMSIKWTGVSFLAIAAIIEIRDILKSRIRLLHKISSFILAYCIIPLVLYAAFFAVHFSLLTKTGPGDAFMTPAFQKTLEGNDYATSETLRAPSFLLKFIELNVEMYASNATLTATHPYSSLWYTWPLMKRPIFYWQHRSPEKNAYIYLFGNPFIYLISLTAIIMLALLLLSTVVNKKISAKQRNIGLFILIGYLLNLLPFMAIGRVMFLYHYFTALIFGIMALAYLIDNLSSEKSAKIISFSVIACAIIFFVYFAPIFYGIPISPNAESYYFWLTSWR